MIFLLGYEWLYGRVEKHNAPDTLVGAIRSGPSALPQSHLGEFHFTSHPDIDNSPRGLVRRVSRLDYFFWYQRRMYFFAREKVQPF